jgi:hypothetical protein
LLLDNPFAKVNKPMFLRLVRDVARSLGVQLVPLTGIRDLAGIPAAWQRAGSSVQDPGSFSSRSIPVAV